MAQSEYQVSLLHRLAGWIGAGFLHLIGRTSAVQKVDDPAYLEYRRERRPVIYAFWHNHQLFPTFAHRGEGASVIVSRSKDGEFIAQIMKRMGLNAVRGSTTRGGQSAFREMVSLLEQGKQVGFTPDGPRGPARVVQQGVVAAAQMTGAPIVPVAVASRRKMTFNSWDKFFVPLPFSHIVVHHGRPFRIAPDESMESASARVKDALDRAVETAEAAERSAPSWLTSAIGAFINHVYAWLGAALLPLGLLVFMARHGHSRTFRNLGERLNPGGIRATRGRRLWLHAASVGEWQAMRPILTELRKFNDFAFVLTVSSPEARALITKEEPSLPVRMIPLDLPIVVRRWVARVRPEAVLIAETELWPNLLERLHHENVPVFIVNGRMSERSSRRWRWFRATAWRLVSTINRVFVRTELDGRRFCLVGTPVERVTVLGNTKVDNLKVLGAEERAGVRMALLGPAPGTLLLGGSTWPGEEEVLAKLAGEHDGHRLRVLIAPRSAGRFEEVARLLDAQKLSWSRWSDVKTIRRWDTDILLIDTIGDLKNLYGACDMAFVGGSLYPRGGQNPLEPAAAGIPVFFGPSMENFHEEAEDLKKAGGARQARHGEDVGTDIRDLLVDAAARRAAGEAAANYVRSRQGAARRTAEAIRAALLVENTRA